MRSLIEKILSGDQQAVIELHKTYYPRIFAYLCNQLPRKEDAQEVGNDVFFEAIDGLILFQEKSSISTWLYKIAHNKVVDFYRKRKIKSILLSQSPFLEIIASEIHEPEFIFEKNKVRNSIEQTLHSLSSKYQQILKMHYEEEIPVKEIANTLQLSFKATESLLFRARKSFQQAYERA